MTTGRTEKDDSFDPKLDALWRNASREAPPEALDAAIKAAARREIGAQPHRIDEREARAERRRWWPLAAAATIAVVTVGIVELTPNDRLAEPAANSGIVSDTPAEKKQLMSNVTAGARREEAGSDRAQEADRKAADEAASGKVTKSPQKPDAVESPMPARLGLRAASAGDSGRTSTPSTATGATSAEPAIVAAPAPSSLPAEPAPASPPSMAVAPVPPTSGSPPAAVAAPFPARPPAAANAPPPDLDARARQQAAEPFPAPPAFNSMRSAAPAQSLQSTPRTEARSPSVAGGLAKERTAESRADAARAPDAAKDSDALTPADKAKREVRGPLPVAEWIALIRRLRDEGKTAEALKELSAFRTEHPDHEKLLPKDLVDWRSPDK